MAGVEPGTSATFSNAGPHRKIEKPKWAGHLSKSISWLVQRLVHMTDNQTVTGSSPATGQSLSALQGVLGLGLRLEEVLIF